MVTKNKPAQKTVLLVEDEEMIQEVITKNLELKDFKVFPARKVQDALDILSKERIDIVWLDHYLLNGENGMDLLAEMKKQNSPYREIPIFVVSNSVSPEKIDSYINLGANRYFLKAGDLGEIIRETRALVG